MVFIRESVGQDEGEAQKNEDEKKKINTADENTDRNHEHKDIPADSQPITVATQVEQPVDEVQEAEKEI